MGEARGRGDEAGNVTLGSHSDQTGKQTQRSTDREEAGRRRSRSSCSLMAAAAPPPPPAIRRSRGHDLRPRMSVAAKPNGEAPG